MIEGYVNVFGHSRIQIVVAGSRSEQTVEALIDTGFDGDICVPIQIAIQLGLELYSASAVELADGTIKQELVFKGIVRLGTEEITAELMLIDSENVLLGLYKKLCIDYRNGTVKINED